MCSDVNIISRRPTSNNGFAEPQPRPAHRWSWPDLPRTLRVKCSCRLYASTASFTSWPSYASTEVDTFAGNVSLGILGSIFVSGRHKFLTMVPDRAADAPAKGWFACTVLPPRWSPCVGEGETDPTQIAVMRLCFCVCFASVALPSSRRACRRSCLRFSGSWYFTAGGRSR